MEGICTFETMLNSSFLAYQKNHSGAVSNSNQSLQSFFEEELGLTGLKCFESTPSVSFEQRLTKVDNDVKELEDQLNSLKNMLNTVTSARRRPIITSEQKIKKTNISSTKVKINHLMTKKIEGFRSKYDIKQEVTKINRSSRKIHK